MSFLDTGIVKRTTITSLVATYEASVDGTRKAYEQLHESKELLNRTIGDHYDYVTPEDWHVHCVEFLNEHDKVKKLLRYNFWRYVIDLTQIKQRMCKANLKELEDQLQTNKLPEFTVESIMAFINNMAEDAPELIRKSILEVFEILMPGRNRFNAHKTNVKYAAGQLGKKVILTHILDMDNWRHCVSYYYHDNINAIGKVFAMLDGKGVPEYPNRLVDQIDSALQLHQDQIETEYFKLKFYKNGNLHIEFKRMNLVKEINRVGADHHSLKSAM